MEWYLRYLVARTCITAPCQETAKAESILVLQLMDDAGAVLSCATTTTNALSFLHRIPLLPPRQRLVVHTPHTLGNTRPPLPSANTQSFVLCKQVGPKAAENHSISQQNSHNHNQWACCHQFTGRCSERGSYPPAQLTSPAGPRGFALVPRI